MEKGKVMFDKVMAELTAFNFVEGTIANKLAGSLVVLSTGSFGDKVIEDLSIYVACCVEDTLDGMEDVYEEDRYVVRALSYYITRTAAKAAVFAMGFFLSSIFLSTLLGLGQVSFSVIGSLMAGCVGSVCRAPSLYSNIINLRAPVIESDGISLAVIGATDREMQILQLRKRCTIVHEEETGGALSAEIQGEVLYVYDKNGVPIRAKDSVPREMLFLFQNFAWSGGWIKGDTFFEQAGSCHMRLLAANERPELEQPVLQAEVCVNNGEDDVDLLPTVMAWPSPDSLRVNGLLTQ